MEHCRSSDQETSTNNKMQAQNPNSLEGRKNQLQEEDRKNQLQEQSMTTLGHSGIEKIAPPPPKVLWALLLAVGILVTFASFGGIAYLLPGGARSMRQQIATAHKHVLSNETELASLQMALQGMPPLLIEEDERALEDVKNALKNQRHVYEEAVDKHRLQLESAQAANTLIGRLKSWLRWFLSWLRLMEFDDYNLPTIANASALLQDAKDNLLKFDRSPEANRLRATIDSLSAKITEAKKQHEARVKELKDRISVSQRACAHARRTEANARASVAAIRFADLDSLRQEYPTRDYFAVMLLALAPCAALVAYACADGARSAYHRGRVAVAQWQEAETASCASRVFDAVVAALLATGFHLACIISYMLYSEHFDPYILPFIRPFIPMVLQINFAVNAAVGLYWFLYTLLPGSIQSIITILKGLAVIGGVLYLSSEHASFITPKMWKQVFPLATAEAIVYGLEQLCSAFILPRLPRAARPLLILVYIVVGINFAVLGRQRYLYPTGRGPLLFEALLFPLKIVYDITNGPGGLSFMGAAAIAIASHALILEGPLLILLMLQNGVVGALVASFAFIYFIAGAGLQGGIAWLLYPLWTESFRFCVFILSDMALVLIIYLLVGLAAIQFAWICLSAWIKQACQLLCETVEAYREPKQTGDELIEGGKDEIQNGNAENNATASLVLTGQGKRRTLPRRWALAFFLSVAYLAPFVLTAVSETVSN